jgi:hypothetical protein
MTSSLSITSKPSATINAVTSLAIDTLYRQASFVREVMRRFLRFVGAPYVAIISLAILNTLT